MAEPPPRCAPCKGWGFVPEVTPMRTCPACGGSGRPARQKELTDV